jgi:hypothetical protein
MICGLAQAPEYFAWPDSLKSILSYNPVSVN